MGGAETEGVRKGEGEEGSRRSSRGGKGGRIK